AKVGIDEIDAAGVLLDADLTLARSADFDLFVYQNFWAADLMNAHCSNHWSSPIVTMQSLWLEIGRDHRWSGGRRKAIGPRKIIMCSRCAYALAVRSWMVTPEKAH